MDEKIKESIAIINHRLDSHEKAIAELRDQNVKQDMKLGKIHDDTQELIEMSRDIKGALHMTSKFGNVLKWIVGIVGAFVSAYVAWKGLGDE